MLAAIVWHGRPCGSLVHVVASSKRTLLSIIIILDYLPALATSLLTSAHIVIRRHCLGCKQLLLHLRVDKVLGLNHIRIHPSTRSSPFEHTLSCLIGHLNHGSLVHSRIVEENV